MTIFTHIAQPSWPTMAWSLREIKIYASAAALSGIMCLIVAGAPLLTELVAALSAVGLIAWGAVHVWYRQGRWRLARPLTARKTLRKTARHQAPAIHHHEEDQLEG